MRFSYRLPRTLRVRALLALSLASVITIPTLANAQIRVGSSSGSYGDWVYYQDQNTATQSDDTPIIQDACVLQYQINGTTQYKAYVDKSMKRIGDAMGIPVQYMGITSTVPSQTQRNPILTFSFITDPTSKGYAAVAYPFAVFKDPNADPNKAESYLNFILRGGVVNVNLGLIPSHLIENTILHEGSHLVGLGDRYTDDSMMGTRYYTTGSDYSAKDYELLRTAGSVSRDPSKCWMSPTADPSLRPDVTGTPTTTTTTTKPTTTTTKPSTTSTSIATTTTTSTTTTVPVPTSYISKMSITTTYDRIPRKVGDKVTFSFKVTNTGNTGLSQIKLSMPSLNKPGTTSFATIPGLYAGWSQTVTAVYTWDGRNFFGSQNKLTATATPLSVNNTALPVIRYPEGL